MDAGGLAQHQRDLPCVMEQQDGMTVLNAVSNLTLQRTIVEAFVKLIVCRKVTVQKVAAVTGHVLDSQTTQEEESPVILDVHHHEMSDVCSTLGSSFTRPSNADRQHQHVPTNSDTATAQTRPTPQRKGEFFKRNHPHLSKAGHCYGTTRKMSATRSGQAATGSVSCFYRNDSTSSTGSLENEIYEDSHSHSHIRSNLPGNTEKITRKNLKQENPRERYSSSNDQALPRKVKQTSNGAPAANQTICTNKSSEQEENRPFVVHEIDGRLNKEENRPFVVHETDGRLNKEENRPFVVHEIDGRLNKEETNGDFSGETPGAFSVSVASKRPASFCTEGPEKTRKKSLHSKDSSPLHEEQTVTSGDESPEKPTDLSGKTREEIAAVVTQDSEMSHCPQTVTPEQHVLNAYCGDSGPETESHTCSGDVGESHQEPDQTRTNDEHSPGTRVSNSEDISKDVALDEEETPVSPTSQPPDTNEDDEEENYTICLEIDEEELASADQEGLQDEQDDIADCVSEEAEEDIEASRKPGQTLTHSAGQQATPGQPAGQERGVEQGLLEMDSSEPPSQPACSDSSGHDQDSAEKLDPFAHLFEASFPPLDRTHYDTSHPSGKETAGTNNSNSRKTISADSIKQELDDDCMITAAFISPSRRKHHSSGSISHTASPGGSVSTGQAHRMRDGSFLGRAGQDRHDVMPGVWGQAPAAGHQQFRYAPQGRPRPGLYQEPQAPATSSPQDHSVPGHVPNFLAPSSQPGAEPAAHGTMPANTEEGSMSVNSMQQQYHQCGLCSKVFMHRHKFDMHVMMCGGHRPFKCKICSKGFNQRAHLDTHMKFHMGIKRYRCDLCHKAYVMKGDLIRHMKTRVHRQTMQLQGLSPLPP